MMALPPRVVGSVGLSVRLYGVAANSRRIADSFRTGFAADPGYSRNEVVLQPAAGSDPADSLTIAVKSYISVYSLQPVLVTTTITPASGSPVVHTQKVSAVFMLSPSLNAGDAMTVTITHSNTVATSIRVVSA